MAQDTFHSSPVAAPAKGSAVMDRRYRRSAPGFWSKLLVALAVLAPAKMFACAACYGANIDAPMAEGMNWAIFTLGAIVVTVLGAFLTFLIYAIRRSEALEAAKQKPQPQPAPAAPKPATSGAVATPLLTPQPQH